MNKFVTKSGKEIERTVIDSRVALKPYYYLRNGLLHARYTVDDCVELSNSEVARLKEELSKDIPHKQDILAKEYNLQTVMLRKPVYDGILKLEEKINNYKERKNGYQD